MATPPHKTVEMNSVEQTEAIRKLQRDTGSLEQAVLMIIAALAPLGELNDAIGYEEEPTREVEP